MSDLLSHWVCPSLGLCKDTLASQRSVTQPGSPEKSGRPGGGAGAKIHFPSGPLASSTRRRRHMPSVVWHGSGGDFLGWSVSSAAERHLGATALPTAQSELPLWSPASLQTAWDVETLWLLEFLLHSPGLGAGLRSLYVDLLFFGCS